MTPTHALTQLLKLGALSFDEIVKYTAWTHEKTAETLEKCKASGAIEWKHNPSRYVVPTVPKPERSPIAQCLQSVVPAMRGARHTRLATYGNRYNNKDNAAQSLAGWLR